ILPRLFAFNLFEYSDTLSYLKGNHSLKFGVNIKRAQGNVIAPQRLYGSIIFNNIPEFLRGNAFIMQFIRPGSDLRRGLRTTVFGFFAQDDFQLTSNLTLNLGLRYEPQSNHTEVNGKVSNLRDFRNDTQLTVGDPFFNNPTKSNWAPRVGLAWDPFGDGKTAVRAGFGIFYNIQMFEMDIITATSNPPFAVIDAVFSFPQGNEQGVQFPFNFDDLAATARGGAPALESTDFNVGQPYRMQWNLNVQREVLQDTTLTVGYVGARGVDLMRVYQANQPDPVPELSPDPERSGRFFFPPGLTPHNPNVGAIVARSGGADSYYSSLQLSLNKRFSSNFQVQGTYTWGKSIDTSSKQVRNIGESQNAVNQLNPLDTAQDRSLSDHDVQHNLSINYTFDLPGQGLSGPAGHLLGGWQLGGIMTVASGVPLTLTSGYDACRCLSGASLGSRGGDNRPDLAPGGDNNPVLGGPDLYFDPLQFIPGPDGFYGNLGRNTLRIPGVANVDFSLIKETAIQEGVGLQFRAEFFNVFNRSNFAEPSSGLFRQTGSGDVIRNGGAGRIRRTTTTSRQIQFALKLIF
ncbi:MAG: TonB-dependent receptor, partial [Acidobacteriota bacterium]